MNALPERFPSWLELCIPLLLALPLSGCTRPEPSLVPPKPVEVITSKAVTREIVDFEDFTGRIESMERIDIRARVTGHLLHIYFKDGEKVKKNAPLFDIDPLIYKAEFDRAEANVALASPKVKRLKAEFERAKGLFASKSIGQEAFDKVSGDYFEAAAAERVALAARKVAEVHLNYTKIVSPIDGVASQAMIDQFNLVKADETVLTTVMSMDPVFAYFDVDERTKLRIQRLIQDGKIRASSENEASVLLALSDETDFKDHVGKVSFVDNHFNPTTGTMRLRASFPNPNRLLTPGLFVRIRLPIGDPHTSVMIPEVAIGSDLGQKYVYVVGPDNEISQRKIQIGMQTQTLRVVKEGLKDGERVVVSGLQRVRPRLKVDAKDEPIPTSLGISNLAEIVKTLPRGTAATPPKGKDQTP